MRKLQVRAPMVDRGFYFLWKVAKLSPSIEELECTASPDVGNIDDLLPIMELKKLTSLLLFHPGSFANIISKFSFPSLERLHLKGMELNDESLRMLPKLLERLGASVKHLHASFAHHPRQNILQESSVVDVLQPMRRLSRLTMASRSANEFGLPKAALRALLYAFLKGQGAVQQLEFLCIHLDARHAVLQDCTLLRDLVVACRRVNRVEVRCFTLQLDVQSGIFNDSGYKIRFLAEELLKHDVSIKACLDATFRIVVNGFEVTA